MSTTGGMKPKLPKSQPKAAVSKPKMVSVDPSSGKNMHEIEEQMLNDVGLFRKQKPAVTVESLLRDKQQSRSSKPSSDKPAAEDSSSPFGLLSAMTTRLTALERMSAKQAQLIHEKDVTIQQLVAKNRALEAQASNESAELLYNMRLENERYKRQLHEMETFLNDYGLIWAGYRAGDEDAEAEVSSSSAGSGAGAAAASSGGDQKDKDKNAPKDEIYFEIKKMMAAIRDLNNLAGEGHMKIVAERGVAKFKPPEAVSLVFYRNGIFFKNGPLRPYSMAECRAFCKDILDGYFPYELKDAYPDGVVFSAHDRSTEVHGAPQPAAAAPKNFTAFGGAGHKLDGGSGGAEPATAGAAISAGAGGFPTASAAAAAPVSGHSAAGSGDRTVTLNSSTAPSERPPLSAEQFLAKLPSKVVSGGKVIEIRSDIAKLLKPQDRVASSASPALVLVETPTLKLLQQRAESKSASAAVGGGGGSGGDSDGGAADGDDEAVDPEAAAASGSAGVFRPQTPMDITTLRVTLDDGTPPLLIKLRFADTVGTLRSFIAKNRKGAGAGSVDFEMRTNFPRKVYSAEDDVRALLDAGLTPNANLVVRTKGLSAAGAGAAAISKS